MDRHYVAGLDDVVYVQQFLAGGVAGDVYAGVGLVYYART